MRRTLVVLIALLVGPTLAGCEASGTAPGTEPVDPTPWIYEDDPVSEPPDMEAGEVADAIEASLEVVFAIDPRPVFATFDTIVAEGDGACPYLVETVDGYADVTFWQDGCQAQSGAVYEGYGYVYEYEDFPAGGDVILDGWYFLLSGELTAADGSRLAGSGVVSDVVGGSDYYDYNQRQLSGTFVVDGRAIDVEGVPWLDGSLSPDFSVTGLYVPELNPAEPTGLDGRQVQLSGGISGLDGAASTVAYEDVILTQTNVGSACELEPSGTVSVRTPNGNWIDVVFDTPLEVGEPLDDPADCDGCGTAWYRGAQIDSVCVDFAPLFDWESKPW